MMSLPGLENYPAPTLPRASSSRVPALLLGTFAAVWIALAIAPRYRQDWLLENLVALVAVVMLVWSYPRLRLRDSSYAALFLFGVLHEIGAHYTYSEVPYDAWIRIATGYSPDLLFGFERNHYDRALHFLYGALVTPAVVDLLAARSAPVGIWRYILPVAFVMSNSVVYELIEWAAALAFGGDLGAAYLGAQGDPWDAQWDMLLATAGSVLSVTLLRRRSHMEHERPGRGDVQWYG